uniref:Immunoglobulin domain-containing protein n=1 Tax=Denticeps clupeoides TaxID=299321 RepID=A0AAY4BC74_9TELE
SCFPPCFLSATEEGSGASLGVEGGSVKIQCRYRADYIHRPKYFCRDPCGNKDVLIKSEKSDEFKSVGKYSIYDDSPGRSFTVTIYKLTVRDSGIYYCGLDQWFKDTKTRINVSVSKGKYNLYVCVATYISVVLNV